MLKNLQKIMQKFTISGAKVYNGAENQVKSSVEPAPARIAAKRKNDFCQVVRQNRTTKRKNDFYLAEKRKG